MINTDPHWTQYLSAFMMPIVALFGCYIAWRQWRTADLKLKLDLFDRRLSIYNATWKYMVFVINDDADQKKTSEYFRDTSDAKWLFNDEIANYLHKELWSKTSQLKAVKSKLQLRKDEKGIDDLIDKEDQILSWFEEQINLLDMKFAPFLKINDNRISKLENRINCL